MEEIWLETSGAPSHSMNETLKERQRCVEIIKRAINIQKEKGSLLSARSLEYVLYRIRHPEKEKENGKA
jgi:hypothetical protein